MPILAYNFRLKRMTWFLTFKEYAPIRAQLDNVGRSIEGYRTKHPMASPQEAALNNEAGQAGLKYYHGLTGDNLSNFYELYHVCGWHFGRLCSSCKKPFRTPRARFCAECGFRLPSGKVAGPLTR